MKTKVVNKFLNAKIDPPKLLMKLFCKIDQYEMNYNQMTPTTYSCSRRRQKCIRLTTKDTLSIFVLALVLATSSVCAFTTNPYNSQVNHDIKRNYRRKDLPPSSSNLHYPISISIKSQQLHMSSIDRDPDESRFSQKIQAWVRSNLPEPPEDQFTFYGDISSIFFYTFIDHTVNDFYDQWLNSPDVIVSTSASAAIESLFAATAEFANPFTQKTLIGNSFPVWFDSMSSAPFGNIPLTSTLPTHHIQYAPAIDTFGMASVLLASSWMICGYFTGVFKFENTLNCSTRKALVTTAFNWILTCIVMLAIAYTSDLLVGNFDFNHRIVGLSRADGDFILDSLSVLIVWRFTISSFFGYGNDAEDDEK